MSPLQGNNTRTREGRYAGRGWGRGSSIVVSLVESVGQSNNSGEEYGCNVSVFWGDGVGSLVSLLSMCWGEGVGSLVSSLSMCWGKA